jgi:hypothetical protein
VKADYFVNAFNNCYNTGSKYKIPMYGDKSFTSEITNLPLATDSGFNWYFKSPKKIESPMFSIGGVKLEDYFAKLKPNQLKETFSVSADNILGDYLRLLPNNFVDGDFKKGIISYPVD